MNPYYSFWIVSFLLLPVVMAQMWIAQRITFSFIKIKPKAIKVFGVTLGAYAVVLLFLLSIKRLGAIDATTLRGLSVVIGFCALGFFHTLIRSDGEKRLKFSQAIVVAVCQVIGGVLVFILALLLIGLLRRLISWIL